MPHAAQPAARSAPAPATRRRPSAPPVLVRQVRGGIAESEHRGHIVEVDVEGRMVHVLGDPDRLVTLRSAVKPFGAIAFVEAGGIEAFDVTPAELAIMTGSHSGEDLHVRTLQALYRRAGISQTALACGTEGMPLDELTAARLARDGERPGAIRHMCSGQHSVFLLMSRMNGWPQEGYWKEDHPAQKALRVAVARAFAVPPASLVTAIDGCGIPTFAFPLRAIAATYALLAEPSAVSSRDPRTSVVPALVRIRDAMIAHPEMVGGTRDRLDTSLMKALPGRVVSKGGAEALRALAILAGPRSNGRSAATGLALKIEDGDGFDRAGWAATIEALVQTGVLSDQALRAVARYRRPPSVDPHGRVVAEAVADFELAPIGELA